MKRIFAALACMPLLMTSCYDDDTASVPDNEPFFNLAVGNKWVYKRYHVSENGTEYYNSTDTVRVTGQEVIDGEAYFIIEHTDDSSLSLEFVPNSRINEQGHLVNIHGNVLHPGFDSNYQVTRPFYLQEEQVGNMEFASQPALPISVEGNGYNVIPFVGYFTNTIGVPEGEGARYSYQQGIGLVNAKCRFINDLSYIDYRLVSYELN